MTLEQLYIQREELRAQEKATFRVWDQAGREWSQLKKGGHEAEMRQVIAIRKEAREALDQIRADLRALKIEIAKAKLSTDEGIPAQWAELAQPRTHRRWLRRLCNKPWVVYSQAPSAGPRKLLDYLGRYTHRVAISNHRILACQDESASRKAPGRALPGSAHGTARRHSTTAWTRGALAGFELSDPGRLGRVSRIGPVAADMPGHRLSVHPQLTSDPAKQPPAFA